MLNITNTYQWSVCSSMCESNLIFKCKCFNVIGTYIYIALNIWGINLNSIFLVFRGIGKSGRPHAAREPRVNITNPDVPFYFVRFVYHLSFASLSRWLFCFLFPLNFVSFLLCFTVSLCFTLWLTYILSLFFPTLSLVPSLFVCFYSFLQLFLFYSISVFLYLLISAHSVRVCSNFFYF